MLLSKGSKGFTPYCFLGSSKFSVIVYKNDQKSSISYDVANKVSVKKLSSIKFQINWHGQVP